MRFALAALVALVACQPYPVPQTIQPTPTRRAQYVYFFGAISRNMPQVSKGVVMSQNCGIVNEIGAKQIYTYDTRNPGCKGVEFTPMIFGAGTVGAEVDEAEWLLLFNEPNESAQSNITPQDAIEPLYRAEEIYQSYKLVSPAPSQLAPDWLEETRTLFIERYGRAPRWDAIAIHCYFTWRDMMNGCQWLVEKHKKHANEWGAELWLTEFACVPDIATVDCVALESEFVDWLKLGHVDRYYRFINKWNPEWNFSACERCERFTLANRDDTLNEFGRMYKWK